jgi:hypothetical protein
MFTGLSVELGDKLSSGGREHDRVEPSGPAGHPSREGILGRGGYVAA